jgi:hypothetical protein
MYLTNNDVGDRDESKQDDKHNSDIKDQALYTTARLEDRTGAAAAEDAAQTGTARLQQDKNNHSYRDDDLYNTNSWNPLLEQENLLAFLTLPEGLSQFSARLYHSRVNPSNLFCLWE